MVFFTKINSKYFIQAMHTGDKFPPPFKEELLSQADKRIISTCRTKFRGKIIGAINSINLGLNSRLNDLFDKDSIN